MLNYRATSPTFPQESAADQWFSEAPFESYRELGSHMIEVIRRATTPKERNEPDEVVIGGAKSGGPQTGPEELDIHGWIEKRRAKSGLESVPPDVDKRIDEVIKAIICL